MTLERIAKALARHGVASRRGAEQLIVDGRVYVNDQQLISPAVLVSEKDQIKVDGKVLKTKELTRLWRYHKPAGWICSTKGKKTIFNDIESRYPDLPRLISVGRLDVESEGLLLLTNDGSLAHRLEIPKNAWKRRYLVQVAGCPENLEKLEKGVTIDGFRYQPISATIKSREGDRSWIFVTLTEGKNREIRRIFDYLGCPVCQLIRISFGPFQLGNLIRHELVEIPQKALSESMPLEMKKYCIQKRCAIYLL